MLVKMDEVNRKERVDKASNARNLLWNLRTLPVPGSPLPTGGGRVESCGGNPILLLQLNPFEQGNGTEAGREDVNEMGACAITAAMDATVTAIFQIGPRKIIT